MEKISKLQILKNIGKVYEEAKGSKLKDSLFTKIDTELSFLSAYLGTSKRQAFFTSLIFTLNYKGDTVDLNDLISYLKCNPIKILEYNEDLDTLHTLGILKKERSRHRMDLAGVNNQFTINKKITEAILQSKPIPKLKQEEDTNVLGVLEKIYKYASQIKDNEMSSEGVFIQAKTLILSNSHYPLLKKINDLDLSFEDNFLYLYLIWKTITGSETVDVKYSLEFIFDNTVKRIGYMQKFIFSENPLIKRNLVEIIEKNYFGNAEMKLTETSNELLKEGGITIFMKTKKSKNIIPLDKIPFRKLFFSKTEMEQLFLLKDLLKEERFTEMQKRLTKKGLPKGVAVLLHGSPGTGKTEVVKQIAKETNRELMKVDISQSKSMWFGESEKIIKKIFTDYKTFAKECKQTPLLLFNEADAIISKRASVGDSSISQTQNTIQNIILEELENFEGILMATTNLVNNIDIAFERRFLFKIKFKNPDIDIRAKIWESKMAFLKKEDCCLLAKKFNFSGGQIDNIVRKKEIYEIIHPNKITLNTLFAFCEEEILQNKSTKIGY